VGTHGAQHRERREQQHGQPQHPARRELARAVELCRPGGRVLVLGTYWGAAVEFPQGSCFNEIDLIPASMYSRSGASRDIDVGAALLATRPAVADVLITHRFPLDAAGEAFAVARDRAAGAIKVVLEP